MPMEWCCRLDFFFFGYFFLLLFCFSPRPLSPTCPQMHADSPVPGSAALGQERISQLGIWDSHSRLCPCQEFLGADRKRCWPKRHGKPRNVWEHINLLPGGRRRSCQAPIELQACAIFCCGPAAVKQAGQSRIQRGSCCGVGLRMLWRRWLRWQMEEHVLQIYSGLSTSSLFPFLRTIPLFSNSSQFRISKR